MSGLTGLPSVDDEICKVLPLQSTLHRRSHRVAKDSWQFQTYSPLIQLLNTSMNAVGLNEAQGDKRAPNKAFADKMGHRSPPG